MKTTFSKLFILSLISLFLFGCIFKSADEKAWDNALKKNTIEAFSIYKSQFPKGKYVNLVESSIQRVSWEIVKKVNTVESIEEFLKEYPNGIYKLSADSLYDETLWLSANITQNMIYFIKYRDKLPQGKHYKDVVNYINKYLINGNSVYGLKAGMPFPYNKLKEYNIIKTEETLTLEGNTDVYTKFYVFENNEKMLELVDFENKIFFIKIFSKKFKTYNNIGIGSTLTEIEKMYPNLLISCDWGEGDFFHAVIPDNKFIEFYLNYDLINPNSSGDDERPYLTNEFKPNSKPEHIRLNSDHYCYNNIKDKFSKYFSEKGINEQIDKSISTNTTNDTNNNTMTIKNNGVEIILSKTDNNFLNEFYGRYVWKKTGIWEGIPGGITIDENSITLWGSVLNSLVHDKGDYPNINGAVATGSIINNDGNVYSDPNGQYLSMNKFSHKIKYMNFVNRQFTGESWESFNQKKRVLHLHRDGNTLQMIFDSNTVYTMTKQ